jgi:hypothetical protein
MARKPGKYASVINDLPKLPAVEPDRREVVQAIKDEILREPQPDDPYGNLSDCIHAANQRVEEALRLLKRAAAGNRRATEFARAYAQVRAVKDQMDVWWKEVNLLLEAYQWLMVDQMEVEGVTSMRLATGQPVSTYLEPYATVTDKEAFRLWCLAQGLETRMHLHPGATNSLVKDMLLAGDPNPPGVSVWAKTKVRLGSE